ncbi:hypothetical protein MMC13_002130 [Lambiella insularis]|nr:hypothetical protein [Lambiella insularis]
MTSLRNLCTQLGFGSGGPKKLEELFLGSDDYTDLQSLYGLRGGGNIGVRSKYDPSVMLLTAKSFLGEYGRNAGVLVDSLLDDIDAVVTGFLLEHGASYWGQNRGSKPQYGSSQSQEIFELGIRTFTSSTPSTEETPQLTRTSKKAYHNMMKSNIVDLEGIDMDMVSSIIDLEDINMDMKSNIINLEDNIVDMESDTIHLEDIYREFDGEDVSDLSQSTGPANHSMDRSLHGRKNLTKRTVMQSNIIDLEDMYVESDSDTPRLLFDDVSESSQSTEAHERPEKHWPLRARTSAMRALNDSASSESSSHQPPKLSGLVKALADTAEWTEASNNKSKVFVESSGYCLRDKSHTKPFSYKLKGMQDLSYMTDIYVNTFEAPPKLPAKRLASSKQSPRGPITRNVSWGKTNSQGTLGASSLSPASSSTYFSNNVTHSSSVSPSYTKKRLRSPSVSPQPSTVSKKRRTLSEKNSEVPEITFHFFLSDPALGAVAHSASSCDTANAFFNAALAAWKLTAGKQYQEPVIAGLKASWEGAKRAIVVPWRDNKSYRQLKMTLSTAKPAEDGNVDVEVQCIVPS